MIERKFIVVEEGSGDWMEWSLNDEAEYIDVDLSEGAAGYAATRLSLANAEKIASFLTAAIAEMKEGKS